MSSSEARIHANRRNAALSTGPKTEEGKERSRANAYKHGMTGAGVVLSESDAIEVKRRSGTFAQELNATGDIEVALAHRAALNSVRMERGADQQTAALTVRVRQVEADFVAPEDVTAEEADRLRAEAVRAAMFDPSKEATRARGYEAAAERNFFRALKELREIQKQAKVHPQVVSDQKMNTSMALFSQMQTKAREQDAEFDAFFAEYDEKLPKRPAHSPQIAPSMIGNKVPFSVGRPR